jgi:general secretion pathway protein D
MMNPLKRQRAKRPSTRGIACALVLALAMGLAPLVASAQAAQAGSRNDGVQLDFQDVEISVVIDTIARLTGKNFIYDDRVRGRVTIVSPTKVTIDEAYAVFESVLQVKNFTTVVGPGGAIKVIPIRDAKENNVETVVGRSAVPRSDRVITRLIPLRYIDAEAITNTLKPLVSKDASMVAYPPTNTVILTDAATNISRILGILRSIDVETYKEELTVIRVVHADASTLAQQLSEIFDAEVSSAGGAPNARVRRAQQQAQAAAGLSAPSSGKVRILTDERTNSLIILAARQRLEDLRGVIRRLDVPVSGGGRIHVYYLKHADAEELSDTLSALISGQPVQAGGGTGQNVQALRAAITELSDGVTVTPDAPTNSLVIQASQEGYNRLSQVIGQLDIQRPQVLVEALIMEVDVTDSLDLGFSGIARLFQDDKSIVVGSLSGPGVGAFGSSDSSNTDTNQNNSIQDTLLDGLVSAVSGTGGPSFVAGGSIDAGSTLIQGLITASASVNGTNILSAPHILTLDNEEAEIKVGDNIPIVTSRVQSAAGQTGANNNLATSANIERQDIGITLRVTPQISEGNLLRLELEQEITAINEGLTAQTGSAEQVGVALSNRKIKNTVVVADNETVVIGGLIDETQQDNESKVPWLGDIPILGWLFKTTGDSVQKRNLLIFLTPHIVRNEDQLALESIRKREEFWESSQASLNLTARERMRTEEIRAEAEAAGIPVDLYRGKNPVRGRLMDHRESYPIHRMLEIEESEQRARDAATSAGEDDGTQFGVLAATFGDEGAAAATLQQLIDAGWDGFLETEDRSGTLLYQVKLGPFKSIDAAQGAAATVGSAFELAPTVIVEREDS